MIRLYESNKKNGQHEYVWANNLGEARAIAHNYLGGMHRVKSINKPPYSEVFTYDQESIYI